VVTDSHDAGLRVEFLKGSAGDVPHGDEGAALNTRGFVLPRLTYVEQDEFAALSTGRGTLSLSFEKLFQLPWRNFVIHHFLVQPFFQDIAARVTKQARTCFSVIQDKDYPRVVMASQEKVLIVEDELHALTGLAELVSGWGYRTDTARDGLEALERVQAWQPGIVVTDLKMPRMDGLELLERLNELNEKQAVVVLTAQGSIELAVEAMKMGAYDFLQKPVDATRLRTILSNATRQRDTERELEVTRRKLRDTGVLGPLVGSSKKMQELFALIERVAPSNVSVLITGESGTGKELVARTLHDLSPRKNKPFVAVNCAAIPETLIESEIFGHEKGAFTGALERRAGCFELAEEGTLLLDEIGEMPIGTQAKLLRVLEERKLRRLGSKVESPVDVRVLAATNKIPETAVEDGHLRGDLYYRLNVFNLQMPALREHKEDIPEIVDSMLADMTRKHNRRVSGVSSEMMSRLIAYDWPGNVRELRNTIERAVVLSTEDHLDAHHLPPGFGVRTIKTVVEADGDAIQVRVGATVDEAEQLLILKTLESTGNNKTRAAEKLGISLKTLHNKLKEYGNASDSEAPPE
jgi:DNA-binding NtrC family response regulator